MKKLLALTMMFMLCFAAAGCGGSNEEPAGDTDEIIIEDGEEFEGDIEDLEDLGYLDIDDLYVEGDDPQAFDFGFTADKEYAMDALVAQVDTGDISKQADALSKLTVKEAEKVLGGSFEGSGEYIEEYDDEIDQMAEAVAIEDGDAYKRYLATGVYRYADGEYYQYTRYAGESLYEFSEKGIKKAIDDIKKGYGVTVPQAKVEAAVRDVLENTEDYGGFYSVYDTEEYDRGDYEETISVFVEGFLEDEVCYYLCVERTVHYK